MESGAYSLIFVIVAAMSLASCAAPVHKGQPQSSGAASQYVLKGGTVYDGSGAPGFEADVLFAGDTVREIAPDIKTEGAKVLDVTGMAVCPGFIDVHQHAREWIERPGRRPRNPKYDEMECVVQQGITTTVGGMDGGGELDLKKYAKQVADNPLSANIARLVGHSAARDAVIGDERRPATPEEIRKMAALIEQGMKDGAFGFSSGLEYLGDYATTEEVIALAKAVAPYGGYYETHMRNEDIKVFDAIEEAIRICREGGNIPLSISHIKVSYYQVWHQSWRAEMLLDEARANGLTIYSNWRPSINWASDLKECLDTAKTGDLKVIDADLRKYWPKADAYCFKCDSHPELAGQTLDRIAESWNLSPAEAMARMWGFGDARFEFDSKTWEDNRVFLNDPWCMVSSDGTDWPNPGRPDPMACNCFPIFFGKCVREWKWYPMETAVFKCTGLPAEMLGIKDRGMLKPGMKADIAVFDPNTIAGESHWDKAGTPPKGVAYTIVNGVVVMDHGKHTGAKPGTFIKKR